MDIRSRLKPEGSITSGIATVGIVFAIYNMGCGSMASAHNSDANHPALAASRKKCGYTAFAAVAALTLITRDANVGILGFTTIGVLVFTYTLAITADPATGIMQAPSETSYQPAANVVPIQAQGQAAGY